MILISVVDGRERTGRFTTDVFDRYLYRGKRVDVKKNGPKRSDWPTPSVVITRNCADSSGSSTNCGSCTTDGRWEWYRRWITTTVKVPDVPVPPSSTRLRITGFVHVVDETTNLGGVTLLSADTVEWGFRFLRVVEVTVIVMIGPQQVHIKSRQVSVQIHVPEGLGYTLTPVPTLSQVTPTLVVLVGP